MPGMMNNRLKKLILIAKLYPLRCKRQRVDLAPNLPICKHCGLPRGIHMMGQCFLEPPKDKLAADELEMVDLNKFNHMHYKKSYYFKPNNKETKLVIRLISIIHGPGLLKNDCPDSIYH